MKIAALVLATATAASATSAAAPPPRQILYVAATPGAPQLRVLDLVRGTSFAVVRAVPGQDLADPHWSPGGRRVVYSDGSGLVVSGLRSAGARHFGTAGDVPLAWSRDGRWIAFTRYANRRTTIGVVRPDGSASAIVAAGTDAAWGADSRHLLVTAPHRGILVVDLAGRARPLPHGARGGEPAVSPDGGFVAFALAERLPYADGIAVERLDGTGFRFLTHGTRLATDSEPAWSPDGRTIAFTRGYLRRDQEYSGIVTIRVDGTGERPLEAQLVGHDERPAWSPDGRTIAFDRDAAVEPIGEAVRLMVVDVASRQARVVAYPIARWTQTWRPR